MIFIDLPGLDDSIKALYIQNYIEKQKNKVQPIFVVNLTTGGVTGS
jgi:hypothetical protein